MATQSELERIGRLTISVFEARREVEQLKEAAHTYHGRSVRDELAQRELQLETAVADYLEARRTA